MNISHFIKTILFFALTVCLSGCGIKKSDTGSLGETAFLPKGSLQSGPDQKPLTLRLVVNDTYCRATACDCIHQLASREYEEIISTLKSVYNIDLQLVYCIEEYDLADSIRSGRYDGAICKPWLAFRLIPGTKMNFRRVADVLDPFGNGLLGGMFIVKMESPVQKPSDITGKILAIGQDDSYEKYYLPLKMMKEEGINPAKKVNKSSCTEGINMLLDGTADVAVISDYALVASCAVDIAGPDAFRTIWKTEDIPLCSVILDLHRISEPDAARLQAALLKISEGEMPESFAGKGFVKPVSWKPEPFLN